MNPYLSRHHSASLDSELQAPYYSTSSKKRASGNLPRPSAMQLANLLNPDDGQITMATSLGNLPVRSGRPSLPSLQTAYEVSYSDYHLQPVYSALPTPPELIRYESSGSDTRSESPPTPPLVQSQSHLPALDARLSSPYLSPSSQGTTRTRREIEAAHTLTHVGTGLYARDASAKSSAAALPAKTPASATATVIVAPPSPSYPVVQSPLGSVDSQSAGEGSNRGGTRQYPCPLANMFHCDKKFSTSGHARRHSRTHTGERSAVCPECGHRFSRQDNMQQHRRTHRPGRPNRRNSRRQSEDSSDVAA